MFTNIYSFLHCSNVRYGISFFRAYPLLLCRNGLSATLGYFGMKRSSPIILNSSTTHIEYWYMKSEQKKRIIELIESKREMIQYCAKVH